MATNLAIKPELLEEALKVGGKKTKKETVEEALEEYVRKRKQGNITKIFGKVVYDPAYNYKAQRKKS